MYEIIIAFDINNTIDNYVELLLEYYNKKYKDNIKVSDITDYNVHKFINPNCKNIFKEFTNEEFMKNLKLKENAKNVLDWCNKNFEVRFITSCFPEHVWYFYKFLIDNFDWMTPKHFRRLEEKQSCCDINTLIDDAPFNLIGGQYKKILVNAPWNNNFRSIDIKRCYNLLEVKEELKKLL